MTDTKKRVPVWVLAVYTLLLYSVWAAYHFLLEPLIDTIPNDIASALLGDGVCKNLVWTLPAVLLIRRYSDALAVKKDEMLTWKKEYAKYLLIFPAFLAYLMLGVFVQHTPIKFSLTIDEIITVIFVGVTEELVFRAWLLNATAKYIEDKKPKSKDDIPWAEYGVTALNAVMFLAVHFPIWIAEGVFVTNILNLGFISIIILSVVFSLVFLRTKNILLPITLHMFWDLVIFCCME